MKTDLTYSDVLMHLIADHPEFYERWFKDYRPYKPPYARLYIPNAIVIYCNDARTTYAYNADTKALTLLVKGVC